MKHDPQALLQQLNTLQTQIVELAAASNLSPLLAIGEQTSLQELKNVLQKLAGSDPSTLRQQAIQILDRFLCLTHQDQPDFPPLTDYQNQVREFRTKLANLPNTELPSDVQSLVEGRHPVSVLLTLLDRGNQLQDSEWVRLSEAIAKSLGKPIAIAASRGKLTFKEVAKSPISAPTLSPKNVDTLIWGNVSPSPTAIPATAAPKVTAESPIVFGAQSLGLETTALPKTTTALAASALPLKIVVHIEGTGDREFGASEFAGTRGQAKGIEGFQIQLANPLPGLQIEYMAHLEGVGDTPWISAGQFIGTRGENRRLEGFAMRLGGPEAAKYQICYAAHIQNVGDSSTCANGQYCGTRAQALRIEAMKVWIEKIF
jgi:Clostridial hydrophobic W